jgi:hypothetical protein
MTAHPRASFAAAVLLFALVSVGVAGADTTHQAGVLHVCIQKWGSLGNRGDLNASRADCKGPRDITLQLGPVGVT